MTKPRGEHTIVAPGLVCGGWYSEDDAVNKTCEVWRAATGDWEEVVTNLINERNGHMSWNDPTGTTFLVGGQGSYRSVETVSDDFTVAPASFSLEHDRRLVVDIYI